MGPTNVKKDRRQLSSRFNVNKQNCEIESLPSIKGKLMIVFDMEQRKQTQHKLIIKINKNNDCLYSNYECVQ